MRIYLDACCLSRLTDDPTQLRIREEAESVEHILRLVREQRATWVASTVLEVEIGRNPDKERKKDTMMLLSYANEMIAPSPDGALRAESLVAVGFAPFDALHLACSERAGVDVFLTTDDALVRKTRKHRGSLAIPVMNPLSWYREVLK